MNYKSIVKKAVNSVNPTGNPIIAHLLGHGTIREFSKFTKGERKFLCKLHNSTFTESDVQTALVALNELRGKSASDSSGGSFMTGVRVVGSGTTLSVDKETLLGKVLADWRDTFAEETRLRIIRGCSREEAVSLLSVKADKDGKPSVSYQIAKIVLGVRGMVSWEDAEKGKGLNTLLEEFLSEHCDQVIEAVDAAA